MKDKIKILFMVDQLVSCTGGTEQNISFLLKNLSREKYEIYLILLRDTGYYEKDNFPIEPLYLKFISFYNLFKLFHIIRKLREFINRNKIDVVHTFFPDSEILGLLATIFKKSSKLIAVRRNMGFWYKKNRLLGARIINQFIPHFLVNCKAIQDKIVENEYVKKKKINVIYNPIIQERIDTSSNIIYFRKDYDIKDNEYLIGIVANLRPIKDYDTLVNAAQIVISREKRAKFLFIGDALPEYRKHIESCIEKLGLNNNVRYVGEILNPIPLIRLFDIGVLSSKSEGLSNTLLEYAATAIPTVATDVGGNSEVVVHGHTGFLVSPSSPKEFAEFILRLIENRQLREQFGKNAYEYVNIKFNKNKIISEYDNYYKMITIRDKFIEYDTSIT